MCGPFLPSVENLDAMIAMQTKNKLGKSLGSTDFMGPNGKCLIQCSIITQRRDGSMVDTSGCQSES